MDSDITEKPEPKQTTSNEEVPPLSPRSYKDAVLASVSTSVETEPKVVQENIMGIPDLNNESDSESESESSDDEESSDGEESSDSDSDSDSSDSSSSDDESVGDTLDIENTDEVSMVENASTNPFDDGEEVTSNEAAYISLPMSASYAVPAIQKVEVVEGANSSNKNLQENKDNVIISPHHEATAIDEKKEKVRISEVRSGDLIQPTQGNATNGMIVDFGEKEDGGTDTNKPKITENTHVQGMGKNETEDLLTMPLLHSPPMIHSEFRNNEEMKQDDFVVFERKEEQEVADEVAEEVSRVKDTSTTENLSASTPEPILEPPLETPGTPMTTIEEMKNSSYESDDQSHESYAFPTKGKEGFYPMYSSSDIESPTPHHRSLKSKDASMKNLQINDLVEIKTQDDMKVKLKRKEEEGESENLNRQGSLRSARSVRRDPSSNFGYGYNALPADAQNHFAQEMVERRRQNRYYFITSTILLVFILAVTIAIVSTRSESVILVPSTKSPSTTPFLSPSPTVFVPTMSPIQQNVYTKRYKKAADIVNDLMISHPYKLSTKCRHKLCDAEGDIDFVPNVRDKVLHYMVFEDNTFQEWLDTDDFDNAEVVSQRYIITLFAFETGTKWENDTISTHWNDREGWLDGENFCNWYGITCGERDAFINTKDLISFTETASSSMLRISRTSIAYQQTEPNQMITGIVLNNNNLKGELIPEIFYLRHLEHLELNNAELSGSLGKKVQILSAMKTLSLKGTKKLKGIIPKEIGALSELRELSLGRNSLEGPLPSILGSLRNLEVLDLSENKFHSNIPAELSESEKLRVIKLNGNKLYGKLPVQLGALYSIEDFDVSHNALIGAVKHRLFLGWEKISKYAIDFVFCRIRDELTIIISDKQRC